jgi:HK97 gp10 family phage protein
MAETVRIDGLKELGEALRGLSSDMALKASHAAVASAASIVKKDAKARAPIAPKEYVASGSQSEKGKNILGKKTKSLKTDSVIVQPGNVPDNIVIKKIKYSRKTSEYIVTVRGKKKYGYASRIASLLEFGTVKMPAKPFLGPALESNLTKAIAAMKKRLAARIKRYSK